MACMIPSTWVKLPDYMSFHRLRMVEFGVSMLMRGNLHLTKDSTADDWERAIKSSVKYWPDYWHILSIGSAIDCRPAIRVVVFCDEFEIIGECSPVPAYDLVIDEDKKSLLMVKRSQS